MCVQACDAYGGLFEALDVKQNGTVGYAQAYMHESQSDKTLQLSTRINNSPEEHGGP